jgi:hypothetical protein
VLEALACVRPSPSATGLAKAAKRREAITTAYLMYEVLPRILPKTGVAERRKLAADLLLRCGAKPTGMTPARLLI